MGLACALLAAFASGCGSEPAVDSDGSLVSTEGQIAFMRATSFDEDLESDIYVLDVDGFGEKRLADSLGLDGFPAWSPDGEQIAFTSDWDSGNWEIYVMNADGSGLTRLTDDAAEDSFPAWQP